MNLQSLLKELGLFTQSPDKEVTLVTERIQDVIPGALFVAVEGANYDGNDYIGPAFEKGAAAVITEKESTVPGVIKVRDARLALSYLCSAFYGYPQDKLKIIGITGTNGKTTTAEYLAHILRAGGKKCGVIGTFGSSVGGQISETGYTTPSGNVLFGELRKMADSGCEYCIMEVSSQALDQKRVDPITFRLSVFTNIGSDHLDYHGSRENYVNAKKRLIAISEKSLINADDAYCEEFEAAAGRNRCFLYSAKGGWADFMAKNIRFMNDEISYLLMHGNTIERIVFKGICNFSVYNTLAAAAAAYTEGIKLSSSAEAFRTLPQIKGRAFCCSSQGFDVYVDFAHTPEALSAMLRSLKAKYKGKIICVFGCGGDRDKTKRKDMGRIASLHSDTVIITTDNPRNENPEEIVQDIKSGIRSRTPVFTEADREKAIALAVKKACPGDAVLIAGKGHEEYQICCGSKKYFSDEMTVKKFLEI